MSDADLTRAAPRLPARRTFPIQPERAGEEAVEGGDCSAAESFALRVIRGDATTTLAAFVRAVEETVGDVTVSRLSWKYAAKDAGVLLYDSAAPLLLDSPVLDVVVTKYGPGALPAGNDAFCCNVDLLDADYNEVLVPEVVFIYA